MRIKEVAKEKKEMTLSERKALSERLSTCPALSSCFTVLVLRISTAVLQLKYMYLKVR